MAAGPPGRGVSPTPGCPCTVPLPLQCEAVQFDMSWKVPAILYYARRNLNAKYNLVSECLGWKWPCGQRRRLAADLPSSFAAVKNPIEASVLLAEASLARKQRKCHATFIPLMLNEMPQAGDLVGLDAEFVTLNEVRPPCSGGQGNRAAPVGAPSPQRLAGAGGHRAFLSPAAGGGRAAQRWDQIHHQAQPDVGGQDHVRARAGP